MVAEGTDLARSCRDRADGLIDGFRGFIVPAAGDNNSTAAPPDYYYLPLIGVYLCSETAGLLNPSPSRRLSEVSKYALTVVIKDAKSS
jgi:hypothetical protein